MGLLTLGGEMGDGYDGQRMLWSRCCGLADFPD